MRAVSKRIRPDAVVTPGDRRSGRILHRDPSAFNRMAVTHALLAVGDVALIVALADSFLALKPDEGRVKVLLYLLISFAPFAVVAPLIGPAVDRAPGGRRNVIRITALARAVIYFLLVFTLGGLWMYPLAFMVLVLQKTYGVSKSALVPSAVVTQAELVEANSKLGLISAVCGGLAAIPLGILSLISPRVTLFAGALVFVAGWIVARDLPGDAVADEPVETAEREELRQPHLLVAASGVAAIRACMGLLFFHIFFWLRAQHLPSYWLALAIASVTVGLLVGNAIAPVLRRHVGEDRMLTGALGLVAVAGVVAAIAGGPWAAVMLSVAVNTSASVARMAFESLVQRDAPDANQGRAFARFEARFQLAWVLAGVPPTLFTLPGWLGFLLVGLIGAFGTAAYVMGGVDKLLTTPDGQPRVRVRRTPKASAADWDAPSSPPIDLPPPGPTGDPSPRQ